MFPTETDDDFHNGRIRWQHFVAAMPDAGFAAAHIGGSGVSFAPLQKEGSIVSEPPPDTYVDPNMLMRNMGKRMRKWFGWCRYTSTVCLKPLQSALVPRYEPTAEACNTDKESFCEIGR